MSSKSVSQMEIIAASTLISLVDIRPLKTCPMIYSPLIVIEYTHGECTGRTLKRDWVQEDLLTLLLALPSFWLLIFFLRLVQSDSSILSKQKLWEKRLITASKKLWFLLSETLQREKTDKIGRVESSNKWERWILSHFLKVQLDFFEM